MADFLLPSLGADMDQATVVEWHVKPGDTIRRGDIVVSVETSKGIIDVESFHDATVSKLIAKPGDVVAIGAVLARLGDGESAPAAEQPAAPPAVEAEPAATPTTAPPAATAPPPAAPEPQVAARDLRISPAARKRAREMGVDPSGLQGSGLGGAVTLADVEAAAEASAPAPAPRPGPAAPAEAMRATIAAAMSRSKREIPHYYLATTVDLQPALEWLAARNAQRPITERLLYGILLVRAVALALREHGDFNGHYIDGRLQPADGIHVGVAVALRGGGLVAPALHDADRGDLDALMNRFRDAVSRARGGRLRASEMSDATITVTSLGERSVETVYPVINPPQVAMVGFGSIVARPLVLADGGMAPRQCVQATLAADHRVSDGHRGGLFLAAVADLLHSPEKL